MSATRLALTCLVLASTSAAAAAPVTIRLQDPLAQPNGISGSPAVSADGKVVVFRSSATNLAPGSGTSTLFAYDLVADAISALAPTANGNIFGPSVSRDGRVVAFETNANNLAPGLDSQFSDVLFLDRDSGAFVRASQGAGGAAANGASESAVISGNGRYVAFTSLANNLVAPSTTPNRRQIYVMDTDDGNLRLASASAAGAEGDRDGQALEPNALSNDGRRLVFTTAAENIATVFNGNVSDVIVRHYDPASGQSSYENVNRSVAGAVGTLSSSRGSISPNGRFVVFRSSAANIVTNGANDSDLFVRNLDANTLRAIPLPAGFGACSRARVTDSGEVLMQCAPSGTATSLQVFFAPLTGVPQLRSFTPQGDPGNASSGQGISISADASLVALESPATDLIDVDTNVASDVFLVADPVVYDRLFRDGYEE
jgi:Tol biopolymer transport system component